MIYRLIPALILIGFGFAMPATAVAQSESVDQMRRIFGPPVQTLRKVFKGDRDEVARPAVAAPVARKAEPAAKVQPPEPAPEPEVEAAAQVEPDVTTADIPDPRPRPDDAVEATEVVDDAKVADDAAVARLPAAADTVTALVGLDQPIDFDQRFEPVTEAAVSLAPASMAPGQLSNGAAAPLAIVQIPLPTPRSAAAALAAATQLASLPPKGTDGNELDCMRSLRSLGIVSTEIEPIRKGQCGIETPTKVSALGNGAISMTSNAVLSCRAAQTLATFLRDQVEPLAKKNLRGSVTGIRVAASYSCRTRNNIPGAKLSEHAHGNAIDISAFEVSGVGWVTVGQSSGAGSRFLAAVRKAACGPFTTVLGPGSDGYHKDHLHLDVIRRGKNGTSLYCH